jgi:hypothetical protein
MFNNLEEKSIPKSPADGSGRVYNILYISDNIYKQPLFHKTLNED